MCQSKICKYEHRDGYCKLPENTKYYPQDADCNCTVDETETDGNNLE